MARHHRIDGIAAAALPLVVLVGCIGATPVAVAQSATGVTVDVGDCVKLQTAEERLACFDAAVKKSAAAPAPAASPPSPPAPQSPASPDARSAPAAAAPAPAATAPAAAVPAPQAAASSTAAAPSAAAQSASAAVPEHAPKHDEPAASAVIVAKIKSLRPTVPNAYQITLDNGQVWRQNYPEFYPLQPGQEVTLTPTRWGGAYRLSSEQLKGFIQVVRVR